MSAVSNTTWARETARLAFFAASFSERNDNALLPLVHGANNALEYALAQSAAEPPKLTTMLVMPRPVPPGAAEPLKPLPQTPTEFSFQQSDAPQIAAHMLKPDALEWRPWMPESQLKQQYLAHLFIQRPNVPQGRIRRVEAVAAVCRGTDPKAAADEFGLEFSALRRSLSYLSRVGVSAYFDATVSA